MSLTFFSKMILKNPSIFVAGASEDFLRRITWFSGVTEWRSEKGLVIRESYYEKMQRLMKEAGKYYCETTKPSVRPSPLSPTEER